MIFEPFPEASYSDQLAHAIAGFLLTWLFMSIQLPWWYASVVTMALALTREMIQHPLIIGDGSRTDLSFWAIGIILAVLIID